MNEFVLNILAGLITAGLGFSLGVGYAKIRALRRLWHLERLIPRDRRVQLVLPSAQVKSFLVKGESTEAYFPSNVLIMPMPEGEAIANLVDSLRNLSRTVHVDLTTDEKVSNCYGLTISVGGPSVNQYSRRLLTTDYPKFNLKYPEHVASYGSTTFFPQRGKSDDLLEDYGFLFCSHHDAKHCCIVLCGVWGTGTRAAVQGLIQMPSFCDAARSLATSSRTFLVFRTHISGLEAGPVQPMIHTFEK